jgi:hypothetical protein
MQGAEARMKTLRQRIYAEMMGYLGIVLYLWVVLGLLVLYKSLILREHQIDYVHNGLAFFNALALGKVLLLAQALRLGRQTETAPLAQTAVIKAAMFAVVLAAFQLAEEVTIGAWRGHSVAKSIHTVGGGTLEGILTLTAILWVLLIPFFAFAEVQRSLGRAALLRLLFERRDLLRPAT